MISDDGKTIWIARADKRVFLVPDDAKLPEGELELYSLLGGTRKVEPAAVVPFEISADDMRVRIGARVNDLLGFLPKQLGELMEEVHEEEQTAPFLPEDVGNGLRFSHVVGMQNKRRISEIGAQLAALIEVLKARGVVDDAALAKAGEATTAVERERIRSDALVVLSDVPDKYALTDLPQIDCEARMPLCRARCCTFSFALSTQDLDEHKVRWEYGQPYQIARRVDGYCVHNNAEHGCTVYEARPASCRTYDCRADKRIWIDFERRIPVP